MISADVVRRVTDLSYLFATRILAFNGLDQGQQVCYTAFRASSGT